MGQLNINNAVATDMESWSSLSAPDSMDTDGASDQKETTWMNEKYTEQWGYFNSCPELKQAILMKATWDVGKGWTCESPQDRATLKLISGFGKDTFSDILFNMDVCRYIFGDSYAEIVRGDDKQKTILNIKPLNGGAMRHVIGSDGRLLRYEQVTKTGKTEKVVKFEPREILHFSNNRLADQCHGISVIDCLGKTLLAELESFDSTQKLMNRQARPFIIFKWKTDDVSKIALMKTRIDTLRKLGEDLHIPDDENVLTHEVVQVNPSAMILANLSMIQSRFYRALGMPMVLFGASQSSESGGKMEYFAHETVFNHEQRFLEDSFFAQTMLDIDLVPPTSMAPELARDEHKDANQGLDIQPNDTEAGVGR